MAVRQNPGETVEVINSALQPPPSGIQYPSLSQPQQQGIDENGNIIIFDGICSKKALRREICCNYCGVGAVSSTGGAGGLVILVLFCILVPLGIYCGRKAAAQWRLYLTSSAIFYLSPGQFNIRNEMRDIPLMAINDISVLDETTIVVGLKAKNKKGETIVITLDHCENATEFVEAVKRQIPTMQN